MKPCRTCKFALPDDTDANSGWCHRAPPKSIVVDGGHGSTYVLVGMDKPGCGEHHRDWFWWLPRWP